MSRHCGILMHISSLPSRGGIGTFGRTAYKFADWLASAGQTMWQILPLCPVGSGNSPYQSCSAFAGNPYFIDPDELEADGLLTSAEVRRYRLPASDKVNFGAVHYSSGNLLRTAFSRFCGGEEYERFLSDAADWLDDYAIFMTLRRMNNDSELSKWSKEHKLYSPDLIGVMRQEHAAELDYHRFVQFEFYRQWFSLKKHANSLGISIIGDLPIYVSADSADVWSAPSQFLLDDALRPIEVAGCPPDAFAADGQKWGNPLYNWDVMERDGFAWWRRRLAWCSRLYDITRIDHVQGLVSYFAIPADASAADGKWCPARGEELLSGLQQDGCMPKLIAEDLGTLDVRARQMLDRFKLPGMNVIQYAFDSDASNPYLPHNLEKNSVIYTGTHDNDTLLGWVKSAELRQTAFARRYLSAPISRPLAKQLIRAAVSSVCDYCIIQAQDILALGTDARMNIPSTVGCNWKWRAETGMFTAKLARELRELCALYGRIDN